VQQRVCQSLEACPGKMTAEAHITAAVACHVLMRMKITGIAKCACSSSLRNDGIVSLHFYHSQQYTEIAWWVKPKRQDEKPIRIPINEQKKCNAKHPPRKEPCSLALRHRSCQCEQPSSLTAVTIAACEHRCDRHLAYLPSW